MNRPVREGHAFYEEVYLIKNKLFLCVEDEILPLFLIVFRTRKLSAVPFNLNIIYPENRFVKHIEC